MYAFIRDIILGLENSIENINDTHLVFLKDFAKELGFGITNNHCEEMPYFNLSEGMFMPFYTSENESLDIENSTILSNLLDSKHSSLKINFKIRKILLQKLLEYYKLHVSGFGEIKSLKVLNEVFS
jgi:DNA repair protein RecO (recombination protein O)